MAQPETIKNLCELPLNSMQRNIPLIELMRSSGYYDEPKPPSEKEFHAYILERPDLIGIWYEFSQDMQRIQGWLLSDPEDTGTKFWTVGRAPNIPPTSYADGYLACAAYVARYIRDLDLVLRKFESKYPKWM